MSIDDRLEEQAAVIAALTALPPDATPRDVALARETALDALYRRHAHLAHPTTLAALTKPIGVRIHDLAGTHDRAFAVAQVVIGARVTSHIAKVDLEPVHALLTRRQDDVWLMNLTDDPLVIRCTNGASRYVVATAPIYVGERVTFPNFTIELIEP